MAAAIAEQRQHGARRRAKRFRPASAGHSRWRGTSRRATRRGPGTNRLQRYRGLKTLQFSLVGEDAVQFSNERLTTLPGSHPGVVAREPRINGLGSGRLVAILRDARLSAGPQDEVCSCERSPTPHGEEARSAVSNHAGPAATPAGRRAQFAAMKMERPKPVRWCRAWSTPIRVQNQGCARSTPKLAETRPLARSIVMWIDEVDQRHEPEFRRDDQDQRQRDRKVNQAVHQERQGPAGFWSLPCAIQAVWRTKSAMMCLKVSSNIQPMSASTGTADDRGGNDKATPSLT